MRSGNGVRAYVGIQTDANNQLEQYGGILALTALLNKGNRLSEDLLHSSPWW
jgi:hypothetical protein